MKDFICHLCRREFGIDETDDDNFRNRSDMYCAPCFHSGGFLDESNFRSSFLNHKLYLKPISVKQMYFACAPARNYKLKEDASYKRAILHR